MDLGRLKKQIIKEFAKSPAKTTVLIALCPVAVYFLLPLFLPAKSKVNAAQRAQVITPDIAPAAIALTDQAVPASIGSGPSWQEVNDWIAADWRRKPAVLPNDLRSPFRAPAVKSEDSPQVSEAPPAEASAPATFSQEAFTAMGLKLTGTLVGRNSRSATINGRRFLEGSLVSAARDKRGSSPSGPALLLKRVGSRHAILEMDGAQFRLELDATTSPKHGITVVRRSSSTTRAAPEQP